jgi:hypothetical protein
MQYFMIATNECVAIEKYSHSKTMWAYGRITIKGGPLHYNAFAKYQIRAFEVIYKSCNDFVSVVIESTCNK